jgi:hypothetical protein
MTVDAKSRDQVYTLMLKWFMPLLVVYSIVTISLHARQVSSETWIISNDGQAASVTGRSRYG